MKFTDTTIRAADILISCATKLPDNLVFDTQTEHGAFTVNFLLRLKEENLCDLRKEARKQKEDCFLLFYSISKSDFSNGKAPYQIKGFSSFDFSKVADIKFSGDTIALQPKLDADPVHYVSATLVLKD